MPVHFSSARASAKNSKPLLKLKLPVSVGWRCGDRLDRVPVLCNFAVLDAVNINSFLTRI
jgi:hypothetical protein